MESTRRGDAPDQEEAAPGEGQGDSTARALAQQVLLELRFAASDLSRLRRLVGMHAENAGLRDPRLGDFVLAVNEVAGHAVGHGDSRGRLLLEGARDALRCTIAGNGPAGTGPVPPAAPPDGDGTETERGRGLRFARAFTDQLDITVCAAGTTVTLVILLACAPA
ncbi:ATP-binding protein [Streptomyces sp. cg35]|uniref:ATP-binding protein n=1 Tax=Streptomyces sp. cg35 TaxID=3421650 RepID=UPI003D1843B9